MKKVGDVVVYVDPVAQQLNALVTAVWSETCLNVVFVSKDESKKDSCGRQIERQTSCMHKSSLGTAHGNYWMDLGDTPNPVQKPVEA